jgi:hypothetical protein
MAVVTPVSFSPVVYLFHLFFVIFILLVVIDAFTTCGAWRMNELVVLRLLLRLHSYQAVVKCREVASDYAVIGRAPYVAPVGLDCFLVSLLADAAQLAIELGLLWPVADACVCHFARVHLMGEPNHEGKHESH